MAPARKSRAAFLFLPFLLPALTAAVSLNDFESLPSSVTSPSCISAYKSNIENCQPSDFQNGSQCSPGCVIGVFVKATEITNSCANVVTGSTSLLAIAFHGQLAPQLCKNLVNGSSGSTASPNPTTVPVTSTTPASSSRVASSPPSSTPSTTTTSTSSTSPATPASTSSSSSSSSSSPYSSSSSSPGGIAHESASPPTAGPNGFSTTASFIGLPPTIAPIRPTGSSNGGGGSPFEFSGAASSREGLSVASIITAVGCGLLLLLR
jgi:hypothetical protein